MSALHASYLAWGSFIVLGVTLELLAWFNFVPWNTATWTIRQTFAHYGQLAYLGFIGLMAVFTAHIAYRRSKKNEPEE